MKQSFKAVNHMFSGKLKHISRFSMVGVINTAVDFLMFTLSHSLLGLSFTISQIAGYSFGVLNSFILNRKWTFEDRNVDKKTFHEMLQFVVVNLVSLSITIIAMNLMVKNLGLGVYSAKILVTVVAQITNFLGYKMWVFN